jgi:hypothetical protein
MSRGLTWRRFCGESVYWLLCHDVVDDASPSNYELNLQQTRSLPVSSKGQGGSEMTCVRFLIPLRYR